MHYKKQQRHNHGADMGYGKEIYREALTVIGVRRSKAETEAEFRQMEFHAACPRAEQIRLQKAAGAARIAKAVLSGGDTKSALESLREQNQKLQREYDELLSAHGFTEEDMNPQYSCKDCRDTGFIDGKMCRCLKQLQKQLAYEKLNRSLPISGSSFENFSLDYYNQNARKQMEQIFNYCKNYAQRFHSHSPSLLFRGATGLGKTHLSLSVAAAATEKGFGVIYGSSQNFAVAMEKERFERNGEMYDTNQKLQSCDLLILDDLGTEFSSSYVNAMLYSIVDTRILASRPTIISTNLSFKEMEQRYDNRFVSRISGHFSTFDFMGSDVRIQKRMKK